MSRREVNSAIEKTSDNSLRAIQTETVTDMTLPSAEEMARYKEIDPRIIDLFVDYTRDEQKHRHEVDNKKLDIVKKAESRTGRINVIGMIIAFFALVVMMVVAAYALYLDHQWMCILFSGGFIITVISVFAHPNILYKRNVR